MIMVENLENRKKKKQEEGKNVHSRLGTLLKVKKLCTFIPSSA